MNTNNKNNRGVRRALALMLASGVSLAVLQGVAFAQSTEATSPAAEDTVVVVKGVRGSQLRSVDAKKRAIAQVDAISSEDIGKLPDVTIADSLQRIPGVQIRRDAGEGSTVNLRGLAQTVTLFNGEQYLSAGNIGQAQANFLDVPSQLMNGVVVYKTTDARTPLAGISGTIDLQTRRPFQFSQGLTMTGAVEKSQGDYTKGNDYLLNGLVNWRNDKVGVLGSVVASESNLGNNYSGSGGGVFSNNDWGGSTPANWISPHGYEVFDRAIERKRFGASASFQAKLDGGFTLTGEAFYTKLEEHNRAIGINISNRWDGAVFGNWNTASQHTDTGLTDASGTPWWNVSQYDVNAQWINSFSVNRTNNSDATNYNLELKYDEGGNFTFETRFIAARAHRLSMNGQVQGDLSNWRYDAANPTRFTLFRDANDRTRGTFYPSSICSQYPTSQRSNAVVGSMGGCYLNPNPMGMGSNAQLHVDFTSGHPVFSGFDAVLGTPGGLGAGKTTADYMANIGSYAVGAFSSEGNNDARTSMNIARADGHYRFDDKLLGLFTQIDAGVRMSQRDTSIEQFHLFSNFYAGQGVQTTGAAVPASGCAAQWKAIDVTMNNPQCSAGEMVADPVTGLPVFQGYTVNRPTRLDAYNNVIFVSGVGGDTASGIPGFWAADPADFDDAEAFHNNVFGASTRVIIPGQSYDVGIKEDSVYANGNFERGIFSGNIGVHVITTHLKVRQNLTGATLAYGDTNADTGDVLSDRQYTDILPSLNLNADVNEKLKLRLGYSKTMQPLDLGNYGGALSIATADDPLNNRRIVTSASSSGNPDLDPWRSTNTSVSAEYYLGRASMVSVAAFNMQIDSFVTTGQILSAPGQFVNSDGSAAGAVQITLPLQGRGGKVSGFELGGKFSFKDFTDRPILSNFGVDTNFTYSPSSQSMTGLDGKKLPFYDNSKKQFNLVGWYQDEKLQVRVAYNYRSERLNSIANLVDSSRIPIYAEPTKFVDVNASYTVNDRVSLYFNGSNITGETEVYNYQFGDKSKQYAFQNQFEPRYTVGLRAKW